MRERDAHSSARRSSSRHVRYRAVPRTNRIPAPSSRAYQQKPTRVEGADIVMQSNKALLQMSGAGVNRDLRLHAGSDFRSMPSPVQPSTLAVDLGKVSTYRSCHSLGPGSNSESDLPRSRSRAVPLEFCDDARSSHRRTRRQLGFSQSKLEERLT